MAKRTHIASGAPELSLGNRIYLYDLLRKAIGAGRQTLLPRVEEALDGERLGARDLGFKDTRSLLEALDDFIDLTVFKGGRVYATLVAQPAWDETLAEPEKKQAGAKGWKRKRTDKSLKPVRPRRVKVEAPGEAPESEAVVDSPAAEAVVDAAAAETAGSAAGADAKPAPDAEAAMDDDAPQEAAPAEPSPETADAPAEEVDGAPAEEVDEAPVPSSEEADDPDTEAVEVVDSRTIALTVTYDPEGEQDGVTTLRADAPAPRPHAEEHVEAPQAEPERTCAPAGPLPAAAAQAAPEPPSPESLREQGLPGDLATEVFCPGEQLNALARLLPLYADALGIANEYYYIALERGDADLSRGRISFPLRYTRDDERLGAVVTLKKRPGHAGGMTWTVESVES